MNNNLKNVLYIHPNPVLFGAETRLLDIISNLDRNQFRSFVLLPHTGPLEDRLKELGVDVINLDYKFQIMRSPILRFLKLTRDFIHLVRQYNIDIIHVNLYPKASNFWLAFLILRKPVIVHLRNHYWIDIFEKFVICRAFKTICVSNAAKQGFLKKRRSSFIMFQRPTNSEVIYDGIDVEKFSPMAKEGKIRKELNISPEDFLVGLIGAVDRIKGQDVLIKAANIVVQKHPDTKFVIVGDFYMNNPRNREYRSNLAVLIKDFKLEDKIIFTGFRNDIDLFMNEIDLLVQPSQRESLGTSMIEAMSCAKPVIGTDIDGVPEVIGNNEGGLLLNPRTPEALAEAINFFIEHPDEARKRGLQGRQRAIGLFNVYENIKRIQEIYEEALNHHPQKNKLKCLK
jgi:glycosyltransferase involved in cell wall biosynthesis